MKTEKFQFTGHKGTSLSAVLWLPEETPCCMVQVAHGMTEHMGRYSSLAEELTAHGVIVAGFDLRGHGENPGDSEVATFGEGGWEASIEDMHLFFSLLEQRFPELPHYMLGFSLGSFLLREYLRKYSAGVAGAAILGTGTQPGPVLTLMMAIVKSQFKKAGFDGTTDLVKQLSFGNYNQKYKPNRTIADWLCADEEQLDAYLADPLCRKNISSGLFWQLIGSMKRTGGKNAYEGWTPEMPILLLSGQEDAVGSFGKGVRTVARSMEQAGLRNVTMELLPGARHDLLHENPETVDRARSILLEWLKGQGA